MDCMHGCVLPNPLTAKYHSARPRRGAPGVCRQAKWGGGAGGGGVGGPHCTVCYSNSFMSDGLWSRDGTNSLPTNIRPIYTVYI